MDIKRIFFLALLIMMGLPPKDCIWRIYRDVRFSHDKRPYKEWFGVFPATGVPGRPKTWGKKSMRGGYYVHLQPGNCLFAGGIWDPGKELLMALRREIEANYEEVEDIMAAPSWQKYFGQDFDYTWGALKKVPAGFDPAFKHADWLKHKTYTFSRAFVDATLAGRQMFYDATCVDSSIKRTKWSGLSLLELYAKH